MSKSKPTTITIPFFGYIYLPNPPPSLEGFPQLQQSNSPTLVAMLVKKKEVMLPPPSPLKLRRLAPPSSVPIECHRSRHPAPVFLSSKHSPYSPSPPALSLSLHSFSHDFTLISLCLSVKRELTMLSHNPINKSPWLPASSHAHVHTWELGVHFKDYQKLNLPEGASILNCKRESR